MAIATRSCHVQESSCLFPNIQACYFVWMAFHCLKFNHQVCTMTTVQIRIVNNYAICRAVIVAISSLYRVSLPPKIRMNVDYLLLLLAGVWLGPGKPSNISIFLQSVLDKVHLCQEGLAVSTPSGPRVLRARLLCATFDLPAKAMALNSLQYNGKYGCANCHNHGKHVGRRQLYPP